MQQGVLARHDLDERTERHDRTDLAVIYIADLGLRHDALDAGQGCIHRLLVQTENIHDALVVGFGDGNGRTRRLLNILDHLAAGTDHGTDHILRDGDLYDTRHERTVIRTRLGDTLRQLTQNVHTAHASLFQRLGQHLVRKAIDLDIHLGSRDTVLGTRHLEVHVAQVVLIAQDVGKHRPTTGSGIRNQTHGDTRNGFLEFHAGIHQRQRTGTNRRHRRRAVRLENIRHHTHGIGILLSDGNHRLQRAPSQVTVADLAAAQAAGGFGLACRERREIIVQHELLGTLYQHFVLDLLVHLRTEGHRSQRLRFTAREDRRTVSGGQVAHLAPDGADFVRAAAVQALALVEDHVAHGLLLHVVVEIFVNQRRLLDQLLFRETGGELGLQRIEGIFALVLHRTAGGDGVSLVVKLPNDGLTQLFVIHFVAIGPFHVLAQLLRKFDLYGTVFLNLFVRELDSSEHHLLGHLLHLALDHQNIVDGTADHDVQIGVLHLREGRVDDVLTADTGHTHLRNRTAERDVRNSQCSRCGQSGQSIGLNIFVRRNQVYGHIYLGVIVRRKQGTQRTVDQTGYEDLAVVSLALTLHEAAGIATASGIFLLILHLERHKIGVGFRVLGGYHRSQEHRISHLHHDGAVGLLGQFARFDHDFAAVCQRDRLPDCIVQLLFFHRYFYVKMYVPNYKWGCQKKLWPTPFFCLRDYLRRLSVLMIAR